VSPPIFLINLDDSTDRLEKSQKRLAQQGIEFERVSGVKGAELSEKEVLKHYDPNLNKAGYHYELSRGQIGCYFSHRKAWQRILDSGADYGIVLEDDFYLPGDLNACIKAIDQLPFSWDLIKLAAYQDRQREIAFSHSITPELDIVIHQKPMSGGAAAAITKSAAQRLLEATDKFGRPVDSDIQHFWEKNIKVLSLMPYPVAQDMDFTSTISVQSSKTKKYFWRRKWQQLKTSLKNKEETQSQIEKFKQSLANN
jgi:glycosyl transferase family 25